MGGQRLAISQPRPRLPPDLPEAFALSADSTTVSTPASSVGWRYASFFKVTFSLLFPSTLGPKRANVPYKVLHLHPKKSFRDEKVSLEVINWIRYSVCASFLPLVLHYCCRDKGVMSAITIQKYRKNVSLESCQNSIFLNLFLQAIIFHSKETVLINLFESYRFLCKKHWIKQVNVFSVFNRT